ncbi:MAG TPA: hypothetical protein VD867_10500 [Burkholderiales bacterium]|nr:hypothetical protein [Burkholderiales bacterium]
MAITLACPRKTVGRIVLGPRRVGRHYARIVARADGSGRIELYDATSGLWHEALEECSFSEIWSAPPPSAPLPIPL